MPLKKILQRMQNSKGRSSGSNKSAEEGTRATVRLAESYMAQGLMTEQQALKYLNLTKPVFEQYRTHAEGTTSDL